MDGGQMEVFGMVSWKAVAKEAVVLVLVFAGVCGVLSAGGTDVAEKEQKRIIGATATLTETSTGFSFPARVDTGAETCSLHVEKIEIQDKTARRVRNIGKTVRFLLKGSDGKTQWAEGIIADNVRVKSPSLKSGEYDYRYKVRLTLQWKDLRKEVLVTLNDRKSMEYPLLVGRNFLYGDLLVDVDLDKDQRPTNRGG
jgi:hypothetical protein